MFGLHGNGADETPTYIYNFSENTSCTLHACLSETCLPRQERTTSFQKTSKNTQPTNSIFQSRNQKELTPYVRFVTQHQRFGLLEASRIDPVKNKTWKNTTWPPQTSLHGTRAASHCFSVSNFCLVRSKARRIAAGCHV